MQGVIRRLHFSSVALPIALLSRSGRTSHLSKKHHLFFAQVALNRRALSGFCAGGSKEKCFAPQTPCNSLQYAEKLLGGEYYNKGRSEFTSSVNSDLLLKYLCKLEKTVLPLNSMTALFIFPQAEYNFAFYKRSYKPDE